MAATLAVSSFAAPGYEPEDTMWVPVDELGNPAGTTRLLAFGHVTMMAAPGGTSKGLVSIDWLSRLTKGRPLPGDAVAMPPGDVIIIAPEDDPNEGIAKRLIAANADPRRVFNLTELPTGKPFSWPDAESQDVLRMTIRDMLTAKDRGETGPGTNPLFVIVDPLHAVVSKGTNVKTDNGARDFLGPLQQLAKQEQMAILLNHHTVKSGSVAGSQGLVDKCRHVLMIYHESDLQPDGDPRVLVLRKYKSNISGDRIAGPFTELRYMIQGESPDKPNESHIEWIMRAGAPGAPTTEPTVREKRVSRWRRSSTPAAA